MLLLQCLNKLRGKDMDFFMNTILPTIITLIAAITSMVPEIAALLYKTTLDNVYKVFAQARRRKLPNIYDRQAEARKISFCIWIASFFMVLLLFIAGTRGETYEFILAFITLGCMQKIRNNEKILKKYTLSTMPQS